MTASSLRRVRRGFGFLSGLALLAATAFAHPITSPKDKPAASAFGLGPRPSEHGLYTATLQPAGALRVRRLQTIAIVLHDTADQPVADATITVDGGMPEHGHGLPTQPRVAPTPAAGVYALEGLRFNMSGWWEIALTVATPRGVDRVVFHVQL